MFTCIALYRGTRLSDLELVSLTNDRQLVGKIAQMLLAHGVRSQDPAISKRHEGIREALRVIAREATHD